MTQLQYNTKDCHNNMSFNLVSEQPSLLELLNACQLAIRGKDFGWALHLDHVASWQHGGALHDACTPSLRLVEHIVLVGRSDQQALMAATAVAIHCGLVEHQGASFHLRNECS